MTQQQLSEHETRLERLALLKEAGVIPYANTFSKKQSIQGLLDIGAAGDVSDADKLMQDGASHKYSTAGRLMMFRTHGKLSFATIRDNTADIQIAFIKGLCHFHTGRKVVDSLAIAGQETNAYKLVEKYIDIGDFVGVHGELFVTKHGELTLFVDEYQLLSKALRPLGDKRHGVKDEEKLYRQRYLDMTMNQDTYDRFLFKTKFYDALRDFYKQQGFQEIVTSILGNAASGAAAQPFITHHNDYDTDVYLRIAFETSLKMATVGRFEKVFEIGKDFRNEGSDPSHIQEFTQVEHYAAYWNYEDNMKFTEDLFDHLFTQLELQKVLPIADKDGQIKDIDRSTPWERIDYIAGVNAASGGIDITQYENTEADAIRLRKDIQEKGFNWDGIEQQGVTTMIDYLYKKVLRPTITGPAFVYNYPKTMQPLARQSDADVNIVEQYQVVVHGWEIIKAYSELVDPTIQLANFQEQAEAAARGDEEATAWDHDFLLAMEHGMPPQSGFGMGLERILALLTNQSNIRDVVMFPLMKPKSNQDSGSIHVDETDLDYSNIPTVEEAEALAEKYLTDTLRHCQQVGHIMKYFAAKLGEDEDVWYIAGLLHDIDWDYIKKDADKHLKDDFEAMMSEIHAPQALIDDIRAHAPFLTGVEPTTLLRKYLISVDELSGFIHAYSLMRPTGLEGMQAKGIKKRLKDKSFAAGVDREHVKYCETYVDAPVGEFALEIVEALSDFQTA